MEFSIKHIATLAGHLGVYQLGNVKKEIIYIGVADARSQFGLRGELEGWLGRTSLTVDFFRFEVTMAYKTRYLELVQVFLNDFGRLPEANTLLDQKALGRLIPG
tara:strand:+ start:162 stop:473 length:312 start_codon:yes stop_codon:yes gene_type:complete